MFEVRKTEAFDKWLNSLPDMLARTRVLARIRRFAEGNPGDSKSIGQGVWEMRIHYGPGYRVYYTKSDKHVVLLLLGGDKQSQMRDISTALELARRQKE